MRLLVKYRNVNHEIVGSKVISLDGKQIKYFASSISNTIFCLVEHMLNAQTMEVLNKTTVFQAKFEYNDEEKKLADNNTLIPHPFFDTRFKWHGYLDTLKPPCECPECAKGETDEKILRLYHKYMRLRPKYEKKEKENSSPESNTQANCRPRRDTAAQVLQITSSESSEAAEEA